MQEVCIVIPCYNEEKRLKKEALSDFLINNPSISFCFVNDGSSDNTLGVVNELKKNQPDRIYIVNLEINKGKSEAVRLGIMNMFQINKFDAIGFWDADLSTPLSEIDNLLNSLNSNKKNIAALGSRVKRLGANIQRSAFRHILGRVFSTFSNWILKIPVYDSQCGAKVFKHEIIDIAFKEPFITKWLFDLEILVRIRNHSHILGSGIVEVTLLQWKEVVGSKLRFSDYILVPIDLMKIHYFYNK